MENQKFIKGYFHGPWHSQKDETENPEIQTLMEGPRKWTSFFDRQLVGYLHGHKLNQDDKESLNRGLHDYFVNWSMPFLDKSIKDAQRLTRKTEDQQPVNELNFHVINREMFFLWHSLLMPDRIAPYTAEDLHTMQARLAMQNVPFIKTLRKELSGLETGQDPNAITKALIGQVTEIDSSIVLLEVMKKLIPKDPGQQPEDGSQLIIVPAPSRFEAGFNNSSRAADFLVFDPRNRQAHGLQVKAGGGTAANQAQYSRAGKLFVGGYDADYVTVIDGIIDLGNSRTGSNRRSVVTNPGLISLEYLRENVSIKDIKSNPVFSFNKQEFLQARLYSNQINPNSQPQLSQAAMRVGERILHGLYKKDETPTSQTTPLQEVV